MRVGVSNFELMKLRWKILAWFFVNLAVIGAVLFYFVRAQFRVGIDSLLAGPTGARLDGIAQPFAPRLDMRGEKAVLFFVSDQLLLVIWIEDMLHELFRGSRVFLDRVHRVLPRHRVFLARLAHRRRLAARFLPRLHVRVVAAYLSRRWYVRARGCSYRDESFGKPGRRRRSGRGGGGLGWGGSSIRRHHRPRWARVHRIRTTRS